jgi:hypothetical protein
MAPFLNGLVGRIVRCHWELWFVFLALGDITPATVLLARIDRLSWLSHREFRVATHVGC